MVYLNRKLFLVTCTVVLLALGSISFNVGAQGAVPDAVVSTSLLRIRVSPARNAEIVATVPKGTAITLTGRNQSITWVFGKADTGATGWMSLPYLALRKTLNARTLPVLDPNTTAAGGGAAPAAAAGEPTTSAPEAPVVSGSISGSFELGGQVSGLDGNAVSAMKRAGMHWAKFQVGVGDNSGAAFIQQAHANGFKALLSVKGDKNSVLNPGYFNQYAGYVGTLAGQGADAIEVWNEANLDREWPNGQISPVTYTNLLATAYNAIKKNNRNTIVIIGAPSPTGGAPGGKSAAFWNDDVFYAGLGAAGAGRYADCVGVHYNEGIVSPSQNSGGWISYPTNYFSPMLARALAAFPGKKACFTELGYVTSEGYPSLPANFGWAKNVTVAQQAAWLAQAAVKASASGRVRMMIVWNVNFNYYSADDPQGGYGIIRPNGSCPACDTLGRVAR
ncbi:MAG: hypothetical protein ABI947_22370 [Chloroflexota bacterium]